MKNNTDIFFNQGDFDPSQEFIDKAKAEFLKKGGKVTKITPPKYKPMNGYQSNFYEGMPNTKKFDYYD